MTAQIVSLDEEREVQAARGETLREVRAGAEGVFDWAQEHAVSLAMTGPWRAWDWEQPVGAEVNISLDDLSDTDDPVVSAVAALAVAARELVELLGGEV